MILVGLLDPVDVILSTLVRCYKDKLNVTYASIDLDSGHLSILAWYLMLLICKVRLSLSMLLLLLLLSCCCVYKVALLVMSLKP